MNLLEPSKLLQSSREKSALFTQGCQSSTLGWNLRTPSVLRRDASVMLLRLKRLVAYNRRLDHRAKATV